MSFALMAPWLARPSRRSAAAVISFKGIFARSSQAQTTRALTSLSHRGEIDPKADIRFLINLTMLSPFRVGRLRPVSQGELCGAS